MPNQHNICDKENIIRQLMEVQAQVTVTPLINHGNPKVYCVNSCISPNYECNTCNYCDCSCHDFYNYTLTQVICIEIPISIDAQVNIKEGITCCGRPDVNPIDDINKRQGFYMQMI